MTTSYKFNTTVAKVKEEFENYNWRKVHTPEGTATMCDKRSLGWYITLEESRVSLYVGDTKPDLVEGQNVTVTVSARE